MTHHASRTLVGAILHSPDAVWNLLTAKLPAVSFSCGTIAGAFPANSEPAKNANLHPLAQGGSNEVASGVRSPCALA